MQETSSDPESVILDPSLLIPPADTYLRGLLAENLPVLVTRQMLDILNSDQDLGELLSFWGAEPRDVPFILEDLRTRFPEQLEVREASGDPRVIDVLRRQLQEVTGSRAATLFLSDEVSLAISGRFTPILTVASSERRLVAVLRRVGARVQAEVTLHYEEKRVAFRERSVWKRVLGRSLAAGLVFIIGPVPGLVAIGGAALYVVVADP